MNSDVVYLKTETGISEIKTRALGLRAELRRLLILVDGNTPLKRLAVFVRGSEIDLLMTELEGLGLVSTGGRAPPPTPSTPAVAAVNVAAPTLPAIAATEVLLKPTNAQMAAVRQAAVRALHDFLGPDADAHTVKIERCKTAQELRVVVTEIRQLLDRHSGVAVGQRFLDAVRAAAENRR